MAESNFLLFPLLFRELGIHIIVIFNWHNIVIVDTSKILSLFLWFIQEEAVNGEASGFLS